VTISVLGPFSVDGDASSLAPRDRVVLEVLVLRLGEVVSAERLADAMWGDVAPPTWNKVVQGSVVRLRKVLGAEAIETSPAGYRLTTAPDQVDAHRFERLAHRSTELLALGEYDRAAYVSGEALALWRGPALRELEGWDDGRIEAGRLEELRLEAEEIRLEAALRAGHHREVLAEAQARAAEAPLRERRWALLALAQYQVGRQGDALRTLHQARTTLVGQLGIEPGSELVALEQAILRQDPSLVAAAALPEPTEVCPYLGLVPYDIADADGFFGREREVEACIARLTAVGVLMVVGPSGSGKSSLVRAGVAASLQANGRQVVVITPGARPMAALPVLPTSGPGPGLVVDQCEEVLTLCDDPAERSMFFAVLAAHAERGPVVIALRADRLGELSAFPDFARLVEPGLHLLSAMSEGELRAAIEGPARQVGLLLEPGLVDLLVREVAGEPGALPLLSHALHQTWQRREGRTLTVDGYRHTGGIRGAVAQSAEEVYSQVPEEQRPLLRGLLLRLVAPSPEGEPVRSRIPRRTVATDSDHERLIELLVQARLVISDDHTFELAHESLARAWPRLRTWLDDDVEGQRILRHLALTADGWDGMGRPDSELYRGVRLAQALEWQSRAQPKLTPAEGAFLEASAERERAEAASAEQRLRQQTRQNRRLRASLVGAAVLLAAAVVAGLVAVRQRNRAEDAASARDAAATLAEARRSGAQALVVDGYDQALLLGVEGRHLHESLETNRNLLAAIQRSPDAIGVIGGGETGAFDLAFTPDGRTLLASGTGDDPGLTAYDVDTRQRRSFLPGPGKNLIVRSALSPDGQVAVVADSPTYSPENRQFELHLVDLDAFTAVGRPLPAFEGATDLWQAGLPLAQLSFSPDGRQVAAVTDVEPLSVDEPPAEARVWDVTRGGGPVLRYRFDAPPRQRAVLFMPDSTSILVAGQDGTSIVDIATGQATSRIEGAFAPLALSPDGHTLAAALDAATAVSIGLFDVATGQRTATLDAGHTERIVRLAFGPDGTSLASGGDDRMVLLWDVATGERRAVLRGHAAPVLALAFSPDGTTLASGGEDQVLLWDLYRADTLDHQLPPGVAPPPLGFPVAYTEANPDGTQVIFTDLLRVQIRDVATGALSQPIDADAVNRAPSSFPVQGPGRWYVTVTPRSGAEPRKQPVILRIWNRETGGPVAEGLTAEPTEEVLFTAQLTPDGRRLAVRYLVEDEGAISSHLDVLDAATLRPVDGAPLALDGTAHSMAFTPDVRTAAVGLTHPGTDEPVEGLVVDLDERRIDRTVALEELTEPQTSSIGAGGRTMGFGDPNGKVVIVDTATGEKRPVLQAHNGPVVSISFAPDEDTFVTTGSDGAIKLWETGTSRLLGVVQPLGANRTVRSTFVDEGRVLIYYNTGEIFEWDPRPDSWEAYACRVAGRNLSQAEWAELLPDRPYRSTCPDYPAGT
jgi:WD40 repeat protein/DNA-binding SARP family transcriptional activator